MSKVIAKCQPRLSLLTLQLLLLLLLQCSKNSSCQLVTCTKQINNCKCETNSGKIIDLSPLAATGDYRFKRVVGPNMNWVYSYNPCKEAQCDTSRNAASCQNDLSGRMSYLLGLQSTALFGYNPADGLHIKYTNGQTSGTIRNSIVSLVCRQNGPDEFMPTDDGGVVNPFVFHSRLTSKYACEVDGGGGGGGNSGSGMSGGDVLLIIFFVLLVVYLAGGFAANVLLLKKTVGVQALPNVTFWVAVPGYVKDGALFAVGKVKEVTSGRKEYQSI